MTLSNSNFASTTFKSTHQYKRVAFYAAWLNPWLEGSRPIDKVDLLLILGELEQNRQRPNINEWKVKMITSVLKRLKLATKYKYCETLIARLLAGQHIEKFTRAQFNECIQRFTILNGSYIRKHDTLGRHNFPKFTYVTGQFCRQNHWDHLESQFPPQRIVEKLRKQDAVYEKLVTDAKENDTTFAWEFIPYL
jgi:hypothetical protein